MTLERWIVGLSLAILAPAVISLGTGPDGVDAPKPKVKRIAVVPILNTSGEKELDATATRAADVLVAGLRGKPNVEVVERRAVVQLVEELDFGMTSLVTDRAAGTALGKRARASQLVQGSLYKSPDQGLRLTLRLIEVDRFEVVGTARWTGTPGALDEQVGDRLARELLGLPLPEPANVRKARALYRRGEFLFQQEMVKEAIRAVEQAVDLVPNDARFHLLLARCYAKVRGRGETAVKEALKATRLDPTSAEAWFQLGAIHLRIERPDKAVAPLKTAIRLAPGAAAAHSLLARAHFQRKRFAEAITAAERAVAVDEKWPEAHHVLGRCHAERGDHAKARPALERAAALAPTNPTYVSDLAQFYEVLDALPLAITTWERALTLVPARSARAAFIRRHIESLRQQVTPPEE